MAQLLDQDPTLNSMLVKKLSDGLSRLKSWWNQPQASYAAFMFGLRHRWTYFLRTLPDIADLLELLERSISDVLIPALLEYQVAETERDLLALPVCMGGLGLVNPVNQSRQEYEAFVKATGPLVKQIAKHFRSVEAAHSYVEQVAVIFLGPGGLLVK